MKHCSITSGTNGGYMGNQSIIREIDGVKTMRLYDGEWYVNYTDYKVRQIHNRSYYSAEQFTSWCKEYGLKPIM